MGNGNPLPDELFDLLRRCIAYINNIGNKTVTTPAGFFSRLGSSILEPKWAKDVQQLSAAGVTFGKAAFKLLKSLQTNWTSQPPRICLFTWLFTPKKNNLPTSITGITKTLALWLQQHLTSAYFYTESLPFHGDLHTFTMPSLQPISDIPSPGYP